MNLLYYLKISYYCQASIFVSYWRTGLSYNHSTKAIGFFYEVLLTEGEALVVQKLLTIVDGTTCPAFYNLANNLLGSMSGNVSCCLLGLSFISSKVFNSQQMFCCYYKAVFGFFFHLEDKERKKWKQ